MKRNRAKQRSDWVGFYRKTAKLPLAATLNLALWLFDVETIRSKRRFAIDLGCGADRDTFELLRRGWKVLAMDSEPEAIRWIRSALPSKHRSSLRTNVISFEEIQLPSCDLLNASWSVPFCFPEHFDFLWQKIVVSIRSGGRFAGHFFGVYDEWATNEDMTFHTATQVKNLLRGFERELLLEKEWDGTTARGSKKHWHVFSVVARKR